MIVFLAPVVTVNIAIHAQSFEVVGSVGMLTPARITRRLPTKQVVTMITHSLRVMWRIRVLTIFYRHFWTADRFFNPSLSCLVSLSFTLLLSACYRL